MIRLVPIIMSFDICVCSRIQCVVSWKERSACPNIGRQGRKIGLLFLRSFLRWRLVATPLASKFNGVWLRDVSMTLTKQFGALYACRCYMYKLRWKVGIRNGSVEKVWRLVSLLRLISWHNKCSCVRFEEPLAMYKHRGAILKNWKRSIF